LQTKTLTFHYVVQSGDDSGAQPLDVASAAALSLNATRIVDGNFVDVDPTLPYPTLSTHQAVVVDTAPPVVLAMTTNTTDGTYGQGQAIEFALTFDQAVVVQGHPYLLLTAVNSSTAPAVAVYTNTSDDHLVVYFLYTVRPTDTTSGAALSLADPSILVWNATANTTLVSYDAIGEQYHYDYQYTNVVEGHIRRLSDHSITQADYDLTAAVSVFAGASAIIVDTTPPALDGTYGVQTSHADGVLYPGEYVYLTIRFDTPVSVKGVGIYLLMNAGPHGGPAGDYAGRAYIHRLQSDNVTLEFLYIVEPYTNTAALDVIPGGWSLFIPDRKSVV
jgi:hypothetical protein